MNILGILVIYDMDRASLAVQRFKTVIEACSSTHTIKIVNNNRNLDIGDIEGSNLSAEFSGWDEALATCDLMDFDVVIFANDTFCTRRAFENSQTDAFKSTLLKQGTNKYIAGEVCWSINYKKLIKGKRFLLRWVRTSIFAMSKDAMSMVGRVGMDCNSKGYLLRFNANRTIFYGNSVSDLVKSRIDSWIFPSENQLGWHSANKVTDHILLMKAKSVLQELILTRRCETKNINVIDYRGVFNIKTCIFRFLYLIQRYLPD